MDSSGYAIFSMVSGVLWVALAVFELVIAILAQNKYRIPATSLMIVGSVFGLLCSLYFPLISAIGYYEWYESGQIIMMVLNMLSFLLFALGVLQLINHMAAVAAEDDLSF